MTAHADDRSRELGAFQDAFAAALFAGATFEPAGSPIAALAAQPGFAVYRNTVMRGCIDALQANYPAVERLVGTEWFRAAAAVYVPTHRPRRPSLLDYGEDFARFLDTFEPAAELPYLAGVARVDRFWTNAHGAAEAQMLAPAAITGMAPARLASAVLVVHPAARWAWFTEHPIATIWSRNRVGEEEASASDATEIDWRGEGILVTRPHAHVQWTPLAASGCAFLDACAGGSDVAKAAGAALEVDPGADLGDLMARLLEAGAFAQVRTPEGTSIEENPQ